jgi:hypothetical protein
LLPIIGNIGVVLNQEEVQCTIASKSLKAVKALPFARNAKGVCGRVFQSVRVTLSHLIEALY